MDRFPEHSRGVERLASTRREDEIACVNDAFAPDAHVSSISQRDFIGDYIGLAANEKLLFGVWTDRRHLTSISSIDNNVFGSRIRPKD